MKKEMKKFGPVALALVLASVGQMAHATGVGSFNVDVTTISADILAVGGVLIGLALVFLSYKWTRKMLAR